ncbi:MAG TPA: cytochrome P450 [Bacillales bacterium]|nr:cytochrome P450 [Bacillales bacterium]
MPNNHPDFFSESFNQNPYPIFENLRDNEPIYRMTMPDGQTGWIISRYEDAVAALKEKRLIKDPEKVFGHDFQGPKNILMSDPPDHERLRKLVQKAFTPRMIEGLRGRIQEITDELLDAVQDQGEMDLIDAFAFPLPIIVICEMLGVPSEDRKQFRTWSNVLVESPNNPDPSQQAETYSEAFIGYLMELVAKRRNDPQDDLISKLIQVEEEGEKLTEEELYSLVMVLIIAGHETTVNLIGNGVLALLEHPAEMKKLKDEPALIPSAIEEILRYNGPVEVSSDRWAAETFEFRGKMIQKGDLVLVALDSADRDPRQFEDSDQFDITREANKHIAFGKGIHFCLGAPLARLEGEIAISTLLRRMPELRLKESAASLKWRPGLLLRGLTALPVVF